jgi:multicomponent K+:H+ antiporter subunit G
MIAPLVEWALAALLVLGGLFGLIGSWGLIRLPDPLQRLHAPTKATTIGVGAALVASGMDLAFAEGVISWEEALVAVFLFVTAPLSALWLARVHLWQRVPKDSLPGPTGSDWATFSPEDRR